MPIEMEIFTKKRMGKIVCFIGCIQLYRTKDYVGFFAYVVRLCYSIKVKTIVICLKVNDAIHQFRTGGLDHEIR